VATLLLLLLLLLLMRDAVRLNRCRPGLDLALNGLTFSVASGSRCGVVGRTGAGKSTLVAALFRLAEEPLASGRVLLDGVDLARYRQPVATLASPMARYFLCLLHESNSVCI